MFVHEWMTPNPRTISPKTPVMEAMNILREGGYRRLPIVKNDKLVGIVTDKDLKNATPSQATTLSVYELNYLLSKLTVSDVMKTNVITINSNNTIEKAALLMEEHKISGLPVLEGDNVVGMLTITDMLKAFIGVLGLREGGTRVTAIVADEPGILAKVSQAAAPSNIVAVVTAGVKEGHKRELVLRVVGEKSEEFPERLKTQGVEIADVR